MALLNRIASAMAPLPTAAFESRAQNVRNQLHLPRGSSCTNFVLDLSTSRGCRLSGRGSRYKQEKPVKGSGDTDLRQG